MPWVRDPFIVFCMGAFIVEGVCLLGLWVCAFVRIRHYSLFLLAVVAGISLLFNCIQFVLYYHFQWLFHVLGQQGYKVFYYAFSAAQLVSAVFNVLSVGLFVLWLSGK